jgi:hypothetical protein
MRFITAASLIAFGGLIGVGVPVLLVSERPLVAKADISDSPAAPCRQQAWLRFDRNCLSKRDLPWTAGRGVSSASTVETRAEPDPAPEQPVTESRKAAALQEPVPQEAMSGTLMSPAPASWEPVSRKSTPPDFVLHGLAPQEPASQKPASQEPVAAQTAPNEPVAQEPAAQPPAPRRNRTARAAPAPRSSAVEVQANLPAAQKPIRSGRVAKRSTNEALSIVRRFGGGPRDIPGNAYAGNGPRVSTRPGLPLDIRPTSIQDVYYYSVPR